MSGDLSASNGGADPAVLGGLQEGVRPLCEDELCRGRELPRTGPPGAPLDAGALPLGACSSGDPVTAAGMLAKRPAPHPGFVSLYDRVAARKRVSALRYPRSALRHRKRERARGHRWTRALDRSGSNEAALRLVESLPGGARDTQAPLLEFQKAVSRAVPNDVDFQEKVRLAVFLEEYARRKLQSYVKAENLQGLEQMPAVKKRIRERYRKEHVSFVKELESLGVEIHETDERHPFLEGPLYTLGERT